MSEFVREVGLFRGGGEGSFIRDGRVAFVLAFLSYVFFGFCFIGVS